MSNAEFEALLERAKAIRMDAWAIRAQRISWAVGQVMCMGSYHGIPDEWELRLDAANALERPRGMP